MGESMNDGSDRLTQMLEDVHAGKPGATDALSAEIYDDLRAMAQAKLAKRYGARIAGVTIQPTVLASDTLMRLIRQRERFDNTGHLFALASRMMMRVLIDYQRERQAQRRGGGAVRVSLDGNVDDVADGATANEDIDVEALHGALEKLGTLDPRKADVVRYRVLWGMTTAETAKSLGVGVATVERDWSFAKAWLAKELTASGMVDQG